MTLLWLTGGIGNQFFQYAAGRSYSIKAKSSLRFDVNNFKYDHRVFMLDKFNTKGQVANKLELNIFHGRLINLYKKFPRFRNWLPGILQEDQTVYNTGFDLPKKFTYLMGYWQWNKYIEDVKPLMIKELVLKDDYKTPQYYRFLNYITKCNSVSIHIRRGDYVSETFNFNFFGTLSNDYYEQAIKTVRQFVLNPVFFIFSDDIDWVKKNISVPAGSIYVSEKFDDQPYLEFELMKECKNNIIANSTFSWWAAYLNSNEKKVIVIPRKFYNNQAFQHLFLEGKVLKIQEAIII